MRLHNSQRPITRLQNRAQVSFQRKPFGLWWAEGDSWNELVQEGKAPGLGKRRLGEHNYELIPGPSFRMLTLASFGEVMDLSRRFAQPMPHAQQGFFWQSVDRRRYDPDQDEELQRHGRARAFLMDWPAIAREWDGIEILMPVGDHCGDRPQVEWLDLDWDVPSGCAWRVTDLEIRLLPSNDVPEPF